MVTTADWLAALQQAFASRGDGPEGMTTREIADGMIPPRNIDTARSMLHKAIAAKVWEHKGKAVRGRINGDTYMADVYGPVETSTSL